uniref:Uncharacterized protein n=1 Tax=Cyprinus carpio TaxID=7962 RepID=A0A8C2AIM4_CYPCA
IKKIKKTLMTGFAFQVFGLEVYYSLLLLTKYYYIKSLFFFSQGLCCLFIPKIGVILFIVFYTLGNICSLVSHKTLKQQKRMCDKTQAFATVVMLVSYSFPCHTLIFSPTMRICLKFTETYFINCFFLSLCRYSLSYIPFARLVMFCDIKILNCSVLDINILY